jgi:hypothetical protein
MEATLREHVAKLQAELCQDKAVLQRQLEHTRAELEFVRASQLERAKDAAAQGGEAWAREKARFEMDKAELMQRVRELEARCDAAGVFCVCACVCIYIYTYMYICICCACCV